jgi:DNA polymerase I-like protein with 3'-5' exonuclease and polymerase domains|nr:MAG TPA: DNA POLYMERASE [Caudoviricetes sp.]
MLDLINTEKLVCLDIETTGLDRHRNDITSIQIGFTSTETSKYTRKFFDWNRLGQKRQLKLMKKLKECKLVTHNGKFDLLLLYEKTGVSLNLHIDTLVLAHICGEEDLTLKGLTRKYFHVDYDISKQAKTGKITDELKSYALDDVLYPMKLMKIFKDKVRKEELFRVFKHEMRAYKAYYEIEKGGVPISPKRHEVLEKLQEDLRPYKEKLLFYGDINWNSNEQVASILFTKKDEPVYREDGERLDDTFKVFEKTYVGESFELGEFATRKEANAFKKEYLEKNRHIFKVSVNLQKHFKPVVIGYGQGLKVLERTDKGAPSVGIDTLSNYVGNDCVDTLLEYKRISKLITFIESWESLQVDGRIYPSFNITARTGRTTCSNPNIQQCPQDSYVRNLIEARPGWKLAELDYSQLELRVASWLAGDENMQHAYQSGSDLHSKTTELLFGDTSGLSHEEQKRRRTQSKSANFGFLYGMVAKTFIAYAKGYGLDLTQEDSEKIRADFFNAYPTLLTWHEECKDYARTYGYIKSPIGRKRWFKNIHSNNFALRSADERQAINSPVQGFGSDLCTSALADIVFSEELDHSRFNVLGSVHDAILFEIRDDYVDELVPVLKEMMENPSILEGLEKPIPIIADVEVSQCWGGH